jgi:hypothetical protein
MRVFFNSILSVFTLTLLVGHFSARTSTTIGSPQQADGNPPVIGAAAGPSDSAQSRPCISLSQIVEQAAPGSTLVLQGGSYPERLTIQKRLTITAQRGPALIGGYFVGMQENICVPVTQREGTPFNPNSPANCASAGNPPGVRAKLYYPAAAPGDAPVGCGGPFPLIVYAHAVRNGDLCDWSNPGPKQRDYLQAEGLLTRLAAAGIIVISVDLSWANENITEASVMVDAVAYALNENARSGSRLHGAVASFQMGLMGHSTGGAAAIHAAACLNGLCPPQLRLAGVRVGAVGLLAPGFEGGPHDSDDVRGMNAPVLVIHGTNESDQQVGNGPLTIYEMANSPKSLVVVAGANHYGYTDGICIAPPYDNPSQVGGVTGPEAHRRQQQAAGDYLEAFFSAYLLGDASKLDYLRQQGGQQCGNPGRPPMCGSPVRRFPDLDALNVGVSICSCFP